MITTNDTTKNIECPDCGSLALLHTNQALWPGLWECTNEACGASDYCQHDGDREIEADDNGRYYLCVGCGQPIPFDVADPDQDAADYRTEAAIDMARGK
jgi:DNA-directed RNA polymerase subunit RPC12/RpoP